MIDLFDLMAQIKKAVTVFAELSYDEDSIQLEVEQIFSSEDSLNGLKFIDTVINCQIDSVMHEIQSVKSNSNQQLNSDAYSKLALELVKFAMIATEFTNTCINMVTIGKDWCLNVLQN